MIRLFILIFTCLTLICSDVAGLHFTVIPNVTSDLTDDIVDMNCSLGMQHVNVLYSIRIVKEGQSSPLASVFQGNRTIVHDPSNSVVVKGHIDPVAPDTSYLHLSWSQPTLNNSGVYTCEITYSDLTEKTNSSKSVAELTVKRIDMHDMASAIHQLRDQATERDEEIETLRQHLHKSKTERDSQSKTKKKKKKKKKTNNSQLLKSILLHLNDQRESLNKLERKSVERESITDATRKLLLENTNSLKGQDQRLDTLYENVNKLTKNANKLINLHNKCPDGWRRFRNQCFKHFDELLTWGKARDYCQSLHAHLAVILDKQTNDLIHDMAKKHNDGAVWIGLNDIAKEGRYVWDGSSRSAASYTMWSYDGPGTRARSDCGYLATFGGNWYITKCTTGFWFICQKAAALL